jgi:hypothetical protein
MNDAVSRAGVADHGRGMTDAPGCARRQNDAKPARRANGDQIGMVELGLRLLRGPWATAALLCLAAFIVLFALAGQTFNAPFVYTAPR